MDSKSTSEKNCSELRLTTSVLKTASDIGRESPGSIGDEQDKDSNLPPLPEDPVRHQSNHCRLWVGNVDTRITEFTLLKLLQKFGPLEKFDFLYHKSGPDQGKPRGYCFATYSSLQQAEAAKKGLNGKLALSKRLMVRNAHLDAKETTSQKAVPSHTGQPADRESQIRAIEAKLQKMKEGKRDAAEPGPATSVVEAINNQKAAATNNPNRYNKSSSGSSRGGQSRNYSSSSHHQRTRPYSNVRGRSNR